MSAYVNVDGVSLVKSTTKCLRPILCSDEFTKNVYIIGIYSAKGKPSESNEVLRRFVEKSVAIVENGIDFQGNNFTVRIKGLVCDA